MSKIGNLGNVENDFFEDFAMTSMNNVNIGQYSAKGINGSRNVIIGKNAGKIAYEVNNSIFIGTDAGSTILTGSKNISIGDDKCGLYEVNSTINIGYNEIHNKKSINIGLDVINSNNSISINNQFTNNSFLLNDVINLGFNNSLNSNINIGNYNSNIDIGIVIGNSNTSINSNAIIIGNNIDNYKYSLNIDNFICKYSNNQSNLIYIGIGFYNDIPIIIGSKKDQFFNLNNSFFINGGLTTNIIKINNDNDGSIYLKLTDNHDGNIYYYLPPLPEFYENIYLTTDKDGNLNWIQINDFLILTIITQGNTICNDLTGSNIYGKGNFLTHINLNDKNTDDLKEGIRNIYLSVNIITTYFYQLLNTISTNVIKDTENNFYFSEKKSLKYFASNINLITTDNINNGEKRFYNSNDYYSTTHSLFNNLTTDDIKQGNSNLFFSEDILNISIDNVFNIIKEGTSNFLYTNDRLLRNINNTLNLYNTNKLKEGSNNKYYNDFIASNFIYNSFSNFTTDIIKEGSSNFYSGDERLLNLFNSKIITTNDIITSNNLNYFNSNSNIIINTELIKQGSNRYLNNQNVYNTITFNTNTDFYKTGTSNRYGTEKLLISDLSRITSNELNADFINDTNNKNKFIKNNFYNNDISINGFLKATNVNDINLQYLKETVETIGIGDTTDVVQNYNVNTFNINSKLSNMEIKYSGDNNDNNIPFIVINNLVGIHNINPKYELDVNGVINCSNMIFDNSNLLNVMNTLIKYDNFCNVGIGTKTPAEKLQVIGNILASGTIISSYSDIRLKDVVEPLKNPLNVIQNLNGFKYKPNDLGKKLGLEDKIEIGLNAQEVLKNIPEIVSIAPFDTIKEDDEIKSKSGENYLSLRYERIIPYLIEAIKELKKDNDDLRRIINSNIIPLLTKG